MSISPRLVSRSAFVARLLVGVPVALGTLLAGAALTAAPAQAATGVTSGLHQDGASAVKLTGSWAKSTTEAALGGSLVTLTGRGQAGLRFSSTGIAWVARRAPFAGIADVLVDGRKVSSVDLYAAKTEYRQVVFSARRLAPGSHTVAVVRTGRKNPASAGSGIALDAFNVLDTVAPAAPVRVRAATIRTGAEVRWASSAAADVDGYIVYRRTGAGAATAVATLPATATSFADVGLAARTGYGFSVAAVDSSGNVSKRSTLVRVTTAAAAAYTTRRYDTCPTATVTVGTAKELTAALADAQAGTVIVMRPGRYAGRFSVEAHGTQAAPVWLCGPRTAVIEGWSTDKSGGLLVDHSAHLVIAGMTVRKMLQGISVLHSSSVVVADTHVEQVGQEAIHLKYGTTDSTVIANTIRDTGLVAPQYGEGVYIGTAKGNWCKYNDCRDDRSDRNTIVLNDIARTGAEQIEAKEGAVDGLIADNTLDGTAMSDQADSLIAVQSDGWVVTANTGHNAPLDGVQVWEVWDGTYGKHNTIYANTFTGTMPGYAVRLAHHDLGNVAGCDNIAATTSKNITNKTCQR